VSGATVVVEEAPPEQIEAVANAAVEVAAIEAKTEIAVAAIEAETQVAAIEAQAEIAVAQMEGHDEWRAGHETHAAILSAMEARMMEHETQISNLTETVTMQAAAIAALTPVQSPPAPPSEPPEEPPANAAPAAPGEAEPGAGLRKRRWM
jgi:hypothetical protein